MKVIQIEERLFNNLFFEATERAKNWVNIPDRREAKKLVLQCLRDLKQKIEDAS